MSDTVPTEFAYELNGRRIPRERFYAIACDPRRSVAVEACAGAGKTWMLVSRIVRALLEGVQPHEILAITFTKKAAGEMRERLHQWLAQFAAASPDELRTALTQRGIDAGPGSAVPQALKDLYRQVLDAGRPVQIRTFHSWFAALLRTAPLGTLEQLGLPARHELLENDEEAIALVWRRFFDVVVQDAALRADYEASVAAHGRVQAQKALRTALDKRVEFALADAQGVVDASVQPWQALFDEFAGPGLPADWLRQPGRVREALADAARLLGRAPQPTFSACGVRLEQAIAAGDMAEAVASLFTQKNEPRKFSDKVTGIEQVRDTQALMGRLQAARAQHEAWLHQQRMSRLARVLIAEYAALKRDEGWVDMSDVEQAARVLLSDPVLSGWVQERLDARVRQLLIDEFQDTNPLQWQSLHAWLSAYAGAGGGGSAPSVFIVGDPKQSIYRFRRAEPQVFRAAQRFVVEGLGGDQLSCDHTHRNARRVLGAMNEAMAAAQAVGEFEGFRAHTTESPQAGEVLHLSPIGRDAVVSQETEAPEDAWRDSLATPRETVEEQRITLESRQAARWIAGRIAAGLAPREVMVLARKRSRLSVMEDELRKLGIAAQQPEKTELGETPEVQDIVALVDALVTPTHDLSLARALRSPLFGVPDEALVELALRARALQAEGKPQPWFDLLQSEHAWSSPALQGAGPTLARWKRWIDRLPPHDALDAIYHDGDVLARYGQAAPPALRETVLAHLRALLSAALEVGGGRFVTPYAFVRAMRAGGVVAPAVADTQAVRLLTVHGAKGLEAPLVLLLDTDAAPARAETMGVIVDWPGESEAPRRLAFIASESRPPACCAEALAAERAARGREELNALYVAMTRARQTLVLSSITPRTVAAGSWWQRVQPLCEPVPAEQLQAEVHAAASADLACTLPEVPRIATQAPSRTAPVPAAATAQARFGQALHRLLECWPAGGASLPPLLQQRIGRDHGLAPAELAEAAAMAARILAGDGAWAWREDAIAWAGNEVELHHEGELLRLDRLVRAHDGAWWVLDYKSAARPERDAALLEQLRRYRRAVQAACPGAPVQVAFLTGQGRLVEVE